MRCSTLFRLFFFFNDTATTEIYTLSLHDALPISGRRDVTAHIRCAAKPAPGQAVATQPEAARPASADSEFATGPGQAWLPAIDRKSTRLNSSHANISYDVFCLKKKKNHTTK